MGHSRFRGDEIKQRGREIYEQRLRSILETEENIGKVVVIDIETGDYLIDEDRVNPVQAAIRLQEKHPDAAIWGERIGYNAVFALGGAELRRTPK